MVKSALIWLCFPFVCFFFSEGGARAPVHRSRHGFLSRESPVVERVHVNDLFCLNDSRRLGLLFEAALALQRHAQLVHHGTAEWALQKKTGAGLKLQLAPGCQATQVEPLLQRMEQIWAFYSKTTLNTGRTFCMLCFCGGVTACSDVCQSR